MFKSAGQSSVDCPALLFSVYFHLVFIPINLFSPCVPSPMSILICPVTCYSLASRSFWTFLLLFSALCPFSPARFRISLWLPENFGLIYCFSVLYVHFLLPDSVFLSGFRRILDFFPVFLGFMSIFSCLVPCYSLASCSFWTFLLLFCALCPFSPARFRISLWLPDVFGHFYCFSQLYVHFLLPGSVFLSGFTFFLNFFTAFLCFMSIFSCSVPYFSLASGEFWTFFLLFLGFMSIFLVAFTPVSVFLSGFRRILDFFPAFSRLYVHFLSSIYSSFRISLWLPENFGLFSCFFSALCPFLPALFRVTLWLHVLFGLFYCFSYPYVHFYLLGSVFPSGFRMFLDFFTAFLSFMSIFSCSVPYFSLASGEFWTFFLLFLGFMSIWKSIEVSGLRKVRKSLDYDEFGSL